MNASSDNLTQLKMRLQNGEIIFADNFRKNGTITFTYNIDSSSVLFNSDYFLIPNPNLGGNSRFIWRLIGSRFLWKVNQLLGDNIGQCRGIIWYSLDKKNETHPMMWHNTDWFRMSETYYFPFPALPEFCVNFSVVSFLKNHTDDEENTISGYLNQVFFQETKGSKIISHNFTKATNSIDNEIEEHYMLNGTPGVNAYNVVGKILNQKCQGDKIVIISNRHDSWWGECPGDSGAGAGIVLGIAKYFKDYKIPVKYNLTFLQTTGEEYGYRGAQHYSDSHQHDNISLFIGLDQLGFEQNNTEMGLYYKNNTTRKIVWAIANETKYDKRTKYDINHFNADEARDTKNLIGEGSEDIVWKQRDLLPPYGNPCDTICFVKNHNWTGHHQTGLNFKEGDAIKNTNRSDLNITLELAWNVTKYFAVNPDCWFENVTYTAKDSPDDGGTSPDSIEAKFRINTSIPHDKIMIKVILLTHFDKSVSQGRYGSYNYTITSAGLKESFIITIKDDLSKGDYSVKLELYNSSGRINDMLEIGIHNYDDTDASSVFHLYPCEVSDVEPLGNIVILIIFVIIALLAIIIYVYKLKK